MSGLFTCTLLLLAACFLFPCQAVRITRSNLNSITPASRAVIFRRLVQLIEELHADRDYYDPIVSADFTQRVEGREVTIVIAASDIGNRAPWYSQIMCSIFPSWGFIQPGITMRYEFRDVLRQLMNFPGVYGAMKAFQGRYSISYTVDEPSDAPDNYPQSPGLLDNSPDSAGLAGALSAGLSNNRSLSSTADGGADCWPYITCLNGGPHGDTTAVLTQGRSLVSPNGRYYLRMQDDCNLVLYQGDLYKPETANPVWASHTQNAGYGCFLRMQSDCNLVVYDHKYNVLKVWSPKTDCSGCRRICALCVQDDGHALLFDRLQLNTLWFSE